MRRLTLRGAAILLALLGAGCSDKNGLGPNDDDLGDDEIEIPQGVLFSLNIWQDGSAYTPDGVAPEWDFPAFVDTHPVDEPKWQSDPAEGEVVPLDDDDIRHVIRATAVLFEPHHEQVVNTLNSGVPNKVGDLVVFPSLAMFQAPGEEYEFFQVNVQGLLEGIPQRADEEYRTRVIAIAFGNGSGGYVAQAPYVNDTFDGALVWMKATRNPYQNSWTMTQSDWRTGTGVTYGTSLRLLIRGDAAVALIRKSELEALGVTQYRWDVFSYTTNVNTAWSHDFTEWTPID